jgi:hypothetical protein
MRLGYKPMRSHYLLIAVGVISCVAVAYEVPRIAPKPLKETQDAAQVRAHEEAAQRNTQPGSKPVVSPDWVKQIQELAVKNSHRDRAPVEHCEFIFKKDGSLAHLQIIIPTNATRTPNEAGQSHHICSAEFDAKKGGKLQLSNEKKVDGPDLRELFGIDQLPLICQELNVLSRFQKAFTAKGLKCTLEAYVILASGEKSWAWEIGPSEEQMPNVIYGIYYYPESGELRTIPIKNAKVKQKVEAAAKAAGLHINFVKSMEDR